MNTSRRHAGRRPGQWLSLAAAATLAFTPAPALAQQVASPEAGMLRATSSSAEATQHFWAGLDDFENIFFVRSASHLKKALDVDPNLGLARIVYGWGAPGLAQADRQKEIKRGLSALGEATTAELVVGTAFKEWNAGNASAARDLFAVAADMLPDDPHVAFWHAWVSGQGPNNQQTGLIAMRKATERFPDFAASHNILAYSLWNAGDQAGAMKTVRKYVSLAPNHPNSHDSYGELLQWDGRLEEAAKHYRRAIELDAAFTAGYHGLAEIQQLTGKKNDAIATLTQAIDHAPTPQARVNFRRALANGYWLNGNSKAAMEQLQAVATEAAAKEFNNLVRLAHWEMALIDALDRGRSVESHLSAAAAAGGMGTPAQHWWAATAHALAGNTAMARAAAEQLANAAKDAPNWENAAHTANAMVLLLEKRAGDAMKELEQADPQNDLVRAVSAEAYAQMGNKMEAQRFKADVLENTQLNFFNAGMMVARAKVAKMK